MRHGTIIQASDEAELVTRMLDLTTEALLIELNTPRTYRESVDLMRIGAREIDANPDGIDFQGRLFEGLGAAGIFTRENLLDTKGRLFAQGEQVTTANAQSAMAYVWQVTADNSRVSQIKTGQDWVRVHLAATVHGVGMQPMSQALQEFPEMSTLYDEVHNRLAPGGGTVQMLGRLGYGPQVGPAPRWPIEAKLV